ncbi:hypothetical protein WBJ53_23450 [Spirosoma sp. SC4-14]|uniref:hypothetical protein n=1 Tax=Spirosoma sp. SC4-14 TaxID=3128900 RepID=UPI0030D46D77
MSEFPRITPKMRKSVALEPIPTDKKPYLVRGMPGTILYMTLEQATKRDDLIPQFIRLPLGVEE